MKYQRPRIHMWEDYLKITLIPLTRFHNGKGHFLRCEIYICVASDQPIPQLTPAASQPALFKVTSRTTKLRQRNL